MSTDERPDPITVDRLPDRDAYSFTITAFAVHNHTEEEIVNAFRAFVGIMKRAEGAK